MRRQLFSWLLGVCTLTLGCSPIANFTRTIILEPIHFCETGDKVIEWTRDRKLANAAWDQYAACNGGQAFSEDFADGFRDGYQDYLFAGGTGMPPPLPPRRYWKPKYETPRGYQAVEEWFAGFRQGAAAAQGSGLRQYITVSSSVPALNGPHFPPAPPTGVEIGPEPLPVPEKDGPVDKAAEPLPPPKKVTPSDQDRADQPPQPRPAKEAGASLPPTLPKDAPPR